MKLDSCLLDPGSVFVFLFGAAKKVLWCYSIMEQDNASVAWPLQFPSSNPSVEGLPRVPYQK